MKKQELTKEDYKAMFEKEMYLKKRVIFIPYKFQPNEYFSNILKRIQGT